MTKQMRRAVQFFAEWAGYATPPGRMVCALELAKAEQWAREEGVKIEWVPDDDPYQMGKAETIIPEEVLGCILTLGPESVSLWGIGDPSPEYRRVVEAELASELQVGFFEALGAHIRSL